MLVVRRGYVVGEEYARFGYLYSKNGRWNGEVLVPEAWVRQLDSPRSP
jgi:hypothetical protein